MKTGILLLAALLAVSPAIAAPPPAPVRLSSADRAAAFRAAGFKLLGGKWTTGCDDSSGAPYTPGTIETVRDLNGDGQPEAVITEGSSFCYGNTETAFWLVSRQAGGWKLITNDTGIATFLPTRGVGQWPDIEIGGTGFCFPVQRWNGRAYVVHRKQYEGKPCS